MALPKHARVKINEWLTWFNHWHGDQVDQMPLEQKVKWLLKSTQGAYEIMSTLAQAENGDFADTAAARPASRLILPAGVRWGNK